MQIENSPLILTAEISPPSTPSQVTGASREFPYCLLPSEPSEVVLEILMAPGIVSRAKAVDMYGQLQRALNSSRALPGELPETSKGPAYVNPLISSDADVSSHQLQTDILLEEATQLIAVLKSKVKSKPNTRAEIYAPEFIPDGPDVFMLRSAELLELQGLQIKILSELVEYLALRLKTQIPAPPGTRQPITLNQLVELLDALPDDTDIDNILYLAIRNVEKFHGITTC